MPNLSGHFFARVVASSDDALVKENDEFFFSFFQEFRRQQFDKSFERSHHKSKKAVCAVSVDTCYMAVT